jgi:hypothetical protein
MAYERYAGPLGPARGDFHAALIASTIAAVNNDPKKKPPTLADFMPRWEEAARGDD